MQAVAQQSGQPLNSSLQHASGLQHSPSLQHSPGLQHVQHPELQDRMDQLMASAASAQIINQEGEYPEERERYYREAGETGEPEGGPPDSPSYVRASYQDPYQYGETSASASNSGDEDERDYDGKRPGAPLNGLSSKKRRKQSKPIRLGSDSIASEEGGEEGPSPEDGEVRYRRASGDSGEQASPPMQGDTPLNLSSTPKEGGEEKPESGGGLRVLGRELLQNPDRYSEGPTAPPTSSSSPMYGGSLVPFGLPQFMFPFPGMPPTSGSPPGSLSRSEAEQGVTPTSASGRIQIFNPEAYCELCNKEFCNKYFLKTHRANKHGIYTDGLPTSSPGGARFEGGVPPSSLSIGPPPQCLSDKDREAVPVSLHSTPYSGSFMTMSSVRPQVSYAEGRPRDCTPSPGLRQPHDSPSRNSEGGALPSSSMRSPVPSPIRPHSASSAGQLDRSAATPTNSGSPKSGPPPLIPDQRQLFDANGRSVSTQEKDADSPHERSPSGEESSGPKTHSDLVNMHGIRLPLAPSMNPFGPLPFFPMSPLDIRKSEELARNKESPIPQQLAAQRPIPNIPSIPNKPSGLVSKGNFSQDKLRQMGVINADAFCEFCCKEFCNKYFLRVHKLKKHGVCSPELPPEKVQKILAQMAKEAGKTGQPMPPLTLSNMIRPPTSLPEPPKSVGGPLGSPLNIIRPPALPSFLQLPPLDPIPHQKDDNNSTSSLEKPDEREEGRPIRFSPFMEPECELRIDERASISGKSPVPEGLKDFSDSTDENKEAKQSADSPQAKGEQNNSSDTSEGLANLQNMIMKLNSSKPKAAESSTICKKCNKDMENKYFLHAHMMNEHGVLHVEDDDRTPPPAPPGLPQYPADLSKPADGNENNNEHQSSPGLNIPNPMLPRPPSFDSLCNGFPKISEKPMEFPKSIFQQMQGLPRPSFLDHMKKELSGGIDIPTSPSKRPSFEKDPNKKPASLSRSYCEICKKELCNKYFMKTHMMKMHGINLEVSSQQVGVSCEICRKELSSKYFLKVHMANVHGLNEDGSPIPAHMRENGVLNMFPIGELPPPPPLGDFSRLLMQQGEKSLERMKELEKQKEGGARAGHVCSLCSHSFPDIIALQVHIIKNHGALPPGTGLANAPDKSKDQPMDDNERGSEAEGRRPAEDEEGQAKDDKTDDRSRQEESRSPGRKGLDDGVSSSAHGINPFPFPLDMAKLHPPEGQESLKNLPLNEMLHRQVLSQQFPGLLNPLLAGFPGFTPGTGPPNLPFSGPLQHVLGGNVEEGAKRGYPRQSGRFSSQDQNSGAPAANSLPSRGGSGQLRKKLKSFKCSKCKKRFRYRDQCLWHIQKSHAIKRNLYASVSFARKRFRKSLKAQSTGSMSIKQLLELHQQLKANCKPLSQQQSQTSEDQSNKLASGKFTAFRASLEGYEQLDGQQQQDVRRFLPSAGGLLVYLPASTNHNGSAPPQPLELKFLRQPDEQPDGQEQEQQQQQEPVILKLVPAGTDDSGGSS